MPTKTIAPFAAVRAAPALSRGQQQAGFKPVQEYLHRFGYFKGTFEADKLDDATAEALTRYQAWHGLPQTGAFDERTRASMATHRCGMRDLDSGVAFSTTCTWKNPHLTFAFETGTSDVAGSGEFQAVRNAFATWAAAVPLTFTEVGPTQNPDILVDWRPAADPDHSMVGGVLAHSDFPPGCGVITEELPKPLHFDDSEHDWVVGAVADGFDIETVALHEIGHLLGLKHSTVAGAVMVSSVSSNFTKRALTADDRDGIQSLYPASLAAPGTYTIRQKSSNRFLDAHEDTTKDFRMVTRSAQNNDSQRWELSKVGSVFMIRQKVNGRFVDAHEDASHDFRLVTRTAQNNDSQRWVAMKGSDGSFTFRQLVNLRYMDAHEADTNDFQLVTRTAQNNDTQRWLLTSVGTNTFTIRQKSSGRFMDAHESSQQDFAAVTRPAQDNDSQRWMMVEVGMVCTLRQKNTARFADAHESSENDFGAVTRTAQTDDTQRWIVLPAGGGTFTIRQLSNGRFLDAYEDAGHDFAVVTRSNQDNDSQRWVFEAV